MTLWNPCWLPSPTTSSIYRSAPELSVLPHHHLVVLFHVWTVSKEINFNSLKFLTHWYDDVVNEYIKKEPAIFYNTVMFLMITLEEWVMKETIKKWISVTWITIQKIWSNSCVGARHLTSSSVNNMKQPINEHVFHVYNACLLKLSRINENIIHFTVIKRDNSSHHIEKRIRINSAEKILITISEIVYWYIFHNLC